MSEITKPIMLDETGKEIVEKLHTQNMLLNIMAGAAMEGTTSMAEIRKIVQTGKASEVYKIGDQIAVAWTDITNGQKYDCPMDVIAFPTATLQDGEEVPAMRLQWHYATPFGVQFNQYQAFYCAEDAVLKAGTYNITIGSNWGTNCISGKTYQFTITRDVQVGGQLAGFRGAPDQSHASWKVYSYESNTSAEPIETVAVIEGNQGTNLGTLKFGGDGKLNCLQSVAYGYNRWSKSALRQWLNSDAGVGKWWKPQSKYDRVPDQLATKAGFLTGFDEEFREALRSVKVVTALNTLTDSTTDNGVEPLETTYDKMFPLALGQMSINPQLAGEGEACEYWKRASGMTQKMNQYGTYPQIRTFAIENHTSPQSVRLRSAGRGTSNDTWYVSSSGNVFGNYAVSAIRCAPACDIC